MIAPTPPAGLLDGPVHRYAVRAFYEDTDLSGAVYHANYLHYFELGRGALLRDADHPYRTVEESGFVYPVVRLGMEFHRPLVYDQLIFIHSRFQPLNGVRIGFDYVITSTDLPEVVCCGFTLHCATQGGRPVAIDPMTLQAYENFPK